MQLLEELKSKETFFRFKKSRAENKKDPEHKSKKNKEKKEKMKNKYF